MHSSLQRVSVAELRSDTRFLNLRGSVHSFLLFDHLPPPPLRKCTCRVAMGSDGKYPEPYIRTFWARPEAFCGLLSHSLDAAGLTYQSALLEYHVDLMHYPPPSGPQTVRALNS